MREGASVLLDNTWATPLFFDAFAHGVDLSIQAATKYVGGHADVMIGYVTANESPCEQLVGYPRRISASMPAATIVF